MYTRHALIDTTLGELTLVAADEAITGVYYPQHWTRPSREAFGPQVDVADDAVLDTARRQLVEYLDGGRRTFDVPTSAVGNDFQHRVWTMLREIPIGTTATYGQLAERLGDKTLSRLVGQAVGHNPLSIIVPCHRVVGANGKLTGYAGGFARKQLLLDLEAPEPQQTELVRAADLI
jgi:methylated-DNA-[protein]-cysteine S-methyltransferase